MAADLSTPTGPPLAPLVGRRGPLWLRRLGVSLAVVLAVVVVGGVVSSFVTLGEYAIVPGQAQNVGPLIGAPGRLVHHHSGAVFLTDVDLVQVRAVDWLYYRFVDHDASLEPTGTLTGPVSISTYDEQGTIDMATARQAATFAALRMLGYHVNATAAGAIVYQLEDRSSAQGVLNVGDVVTSLDGHPVTTLASLASAIDTLRPGAKATLVVHGIGAKKTKRLTIVTGAARIQGSGADAVPLCLPANTSSQAPRETVGGKPLACLGIYLDQLISTTALPFSVNINSEGIIGPSAGLAFALGIIEKLDPKDLTAGMKVAATGTMSIDGSVGDVGGVAQKTVAVERAGATVFFVPPQEYSTAKAHATPSLRVYAVSTLSEAVSILKRLGGAIAPSTTP